MVKDGDQPQYTEINPVAKKWLKRISIILVFIITTFIILHTFIPSLTIDTTTLGLLGLLIVALIIPFAKSITLPGGSGFTIPEQLLKADAEVKKAQEELASEGLITTTSGVITTSNGSLTSSLADGVLTLSESSMMTQQTLTDLINYDPNLALAGLRIEIEKRVTLLSELVDKDSESSKSRAPLLTKVQKLSQSKYFSINEVNAIKSVLRILNSAAHGELVSQSSAEYAFDLGQEIIKILDLRINQQKRTQ